MDYLVGLDPSALSALTELGGAHEIPPTPLPSRPKVRSPPRKRSMEASYLLRLEGPFQHPRDVATVLGLQRVPQLVLGTGEYGEGWFCRMQACALAALEEYRERHHPAVKFLVVHLNIAHMDVGALPWLGHDPTLPQYRPAELPGMVMGRGEFPVQYFFYGTLADPGKLAELFGVEETDLPPLRKAKVRDGRMKIWGKKYRALVDAPGEEVDGFVFRVDSGEQEHALRAYEGNPYEVVCAKIVVDGAEVEGRTFRYCGFEDELS